MRFHVPLAAALALSVIGLAAAGCGSVTAVEGTINKKSFTAAEAISGILDLEGSEAGVIVISTDPGTCDLFSSAQVHKNTKLLSIGVASFDLASGKVVAPKDSGTFTVVNLDGGGGSFSTSVAFVSYVELDENCVAKGEPITGKSGKVEIDSADDGAYSGSGDVTLSTGEHITFEFDATACKGLTSLTSGGLPGGTPSCK